MIALYILAYDGLVDYGAKAHYRVKHSKNEFANGKNHINGYRKPFYQRECVLLVASKARLSTRATTCVATAS